MFKHQVLPMFSSQENLVFISNFHPLEVVGRSCVTQLEMG